MNSSKLLAGGAIGNLFARPTPEEELKAGAWDLQMDIVTGIAKAANALLCIHGEDGSGKTTFLRQLSFRCSQHLDFLNVTPATPTLPAGWLSQGLLQWLSSDTNIKANINQKLSALAENPRPVLACIDAGDFIDPAQLASECCALLNLADASGLRLSILISCSPGSALQLERDPQITSRLIYNKALERLSETDLVAIAKARLRKSALTDSLDDNMLLKLSKLAEGSPVRMIRQICAQLGLEVPSTQLRNIPSSRNVGTRKAKKSADSPTVSLDDLLAPPNK